LLRAEDEQTLNQLAPPELKLPPAEKATAAAESTTLEENTVSCETQGSQKYDGSAEERKKAVRVSLHPPQRRTSTRHRGLGERCRKVLDSLDAVETESSSSTAEDDGFEQSIAPVLPPAKGRAARREILIERPVKESTEASHGDERAGSDVSSSSDTVEVRVALRRTAGTDTNPRPCIFQDGSGSKPFVDRLAEVEAEAWGTVPPGMYCEADVTLPCSFVAVA